MYVFDPDDTETVTCDWCGLTQTNMDHYLDHIYTEHIQVLRPPDLSVVRERLAADVGKSTPTEFVEDAMYQIEHLVADRFPPASHTASFYMPYTDETSEKAGDMLHGVLITLVSRILEWAESGGYDPDGMTVTLSVDPRFRS